MNFSLRLIHRLYKQVLRLYPMHFRVDFEQEMFAVFSEAGMDASSLGRASLIRFCLREIRDGISTMLIEHVSNFRKIGLFKIQRGLTLWLITPTSAISGSESMSENERSEFDLGSQRIVRLVGLPLLLFGLGITVNSLFRGKDWFAIPAWRQIMSIVLGLIPMGVIGLRGLYALVRRLPDWGWTWVGTAFMGLTLFVNTMVEELADEGKLLISQSGEAILAILIILSGTALIGLAAWRGWRRAGLFSIGLAGTMGLSLCMAVTAGPFNRVDLALLAAPIGLLMAILVHGYTRGSDSSRLAILLAVGMMNAGLILLANQVWRDWILTHDRSSPLVPLLIITTAVLFAGPILGWFARPIQRALGRT